MNLVPEQLLHCPTIKFAFCRGSSCSNLIPHAYFDAIFFFCTCRIHIRGKVNCVRQQLSSWYVSVPYHRDLSSLRSNLLLRIHQFSCLLGGKHAAVARLPSTLVENDLIRLLLSHVAIDHVFIVCSHALRSKFCCLFKVNERACLPIIHMPPYCLHDCHYFYRTALRLLSIPNSLASVHV